MGLIAVLEQEGDLFHLVIDAVGCADRYSSAHVQAPANTEIRRHIHRCDLWMIDRREAVHARRIYDAREDLRVPGEDLTENSEHHL